MYCTVLPYEIIILILLYSTDHLGVLLPLIVLIFLSEVFVDWIKHGFITKFNAISPNVYQKYSSILAKDLRNRRTRMVIKRLVIWGLIFEEVGCIGGTTIPICLSLRHSQAFPLSYQFHSSEKLATRIRC